MSQFMHEAVPIFFMFGCVLALAPFVTFTVYMGLSGDRMREKEAEKVNKK